MSTRHLVPTNIVDLYEVHEWRNAAGVLSTSKPAEWQEIIDALLQFRLYRSEVLSPGGSRSRIVGRLESPLKARGWIEKQFHTVIELDGNRLDSPTHKIDCYKNSVALEVEWNNKDPFFDRDLNNFRLLFDLRAIEVGVIITRCSALQEIFSDLGRGPSFGNSTTHIDKLLPRLNGGAGGGCPVLVFGISSKLYVADGATQAVTPSDQGVNDD